LEVHKQANSIKTSTTSSTSEFSYSACNSRKKCTAGIAHIITISQLLPLYLTDWVKKCMECEVEGSSPRGRPKRTWTEVVQKDCQARNSNREDAMDRGRWKKLIKIG